MRSFRHWTPRYLAARAALLLHERRRPGLPWLTPESVRLLATLLRPDDHGLEWGAGRSTAWLAARTGTLVSVEHDPAWRARVAEQLDALEARTVRLVAAPFDPRLEETRAAFETDYVRVADDFGQASLDFALVDGGYRSACALAVLPKLTAGGILVVDNVNWFLPSRSRAPGSRTQAQGPLSEFWAEFQARTAHWRCIWTSSGVTDTALWIVRAAGWAEPERAGRA